MIVAQILAGFDAQRLHFVRIISMTSFPCGQLQPHSNLEDDATTRVTIVLAGTNLFQMVVGPLLLTTIAANRRHGMLTGGVDNKTCAP